jgi:hypothetical protein
MHYYLQPMAKEVTHDNAKLERLADLAMLDIEDEGLFPNHSDMDIWKKGFIAGLKHRIDSHDTYSNSHED